ncbi:hypothetical protein N7540_003497, partial [Penicillium herquei]
WRNRVRPDIHTWKTSFKHTRSQIPRKELQQIPHSDSTNPEFPSPESGSSYELPSSPLPSPSQARRVPTRSQAGCAPSEIRPRSQSPNSSGSDTNQNSGRHKRRIGQVTPSPSALRSGRQQESGHDQEDHSRRRAAQFCTQRCLLGMQTGKFLDELCPNVDHHRRGEDDRIRHPISTEDLMLSLKSQLDENDDRCIPLGRCGSYGAPFKLTCMTYGYTVIGKGTTSGLWKEVSRGAQVYQILRKAQGSAVPDFEVTNMDGLSSDIYKNVGNLKARNPSLKIMIALGGWSFSDPGPWQNVFPDMLSSETNRATFIRNLLGFLSEYGYDGIDFDWEYPGADDRGRSDSDGVNYTAFLKELRAAIDASGKEYIVTFTAPTSYWYLRHFDLKAMTNYVDWVNLMAPCSYKLTEIDLALDLFWRVEVDPSAIVLGLGFYGRSFQLSDTSCWKPGCAFSGPGAARKCTDTAGILSYREIQDIIEDAGGTAYLDEEAAVRYMIYNNDNWISFDDPGTFQQKIEYTNKMGH